MNQNQFTDDSDRQASLELDQDSLATQHRGSKIAGSARFADDSKPAPETGQQSRLAPEGDDKQRTLGGGTAAKTPEWKENKEN